MPTGGRVQAPGGNPTVEVDADMHGLGGGHTSLIEHGGSKCLPHVCLHAGLAKVRVQVDLLLRGRNT